MSATWRLIIGVAVLLALLIGRAYIQDHPLYNQCETYAGCEK